MTAEIVVIKMTNRSAAFDPESRVIDFHCRRTFNELIAFPLCAPFGRLSLGMRERKSAAAGTEGIVLI